MGATITPGGGRAVTTWFTADLHLGHHNIIDYCNRPFHDVHAMNDALVENWNEAVAPGDTVWVVGDFALGKIADTLPLVSRLHGRKTSWPATTTVAGPDMVGAPTAGPLGTSMPASTRSCKERSTPVQFRLSILGGQPWPKSIVTPLVSRTLFCHTIGHTCDTPQARNSTQGAHTDAASCRRSR